MKLSELMGGYVPSATFAGVATNDDFVLAVDIGETASESVGDYVVVQTGVSAVDAQLSPETEEKIKEETKATIRCIPLDTNVVMEEGKCIYSGKPSKQRVIFARAY